MPKDKKWVRFVVELELKRNSQTDLLVTETHYRLTYGVFQEKMKLGS